MLLGAEPAARLHDELILEVIYPHRREVAFREVVDFVASRRTLAGDHVELVIAVEIVLVVRLPFISSSLMFGLPAAATNVGNQSRPEMMPFFHRVSMDVSGPANHGWASETIFVTRALASVERGLSAVGPSEVLGAIQNVIARWRPRT
jgi:hypothetical protein